MEEEVEAKKQKPLKLDWSELLPTKDDDPPPLLIVNSETLTGKAQRLSPEMSSDRRNEAIAQLSDHELNERIKSTAMNIKNGVLSRLPDKGEKLKNSLKSLEDERERRKRKRVETIHVEEADELQNPAQSLSSSIVGGSKDFKIDSMPSRDQTQSTFTSSFLQKMDDHQSDSKTVNAFEKEMSLLGPCNSKRMRNKNAFLQKQEHNRLSTRVSPRKFYSNCSSKRGQLGLSNGNQTSRASFAQSQDDEENQSKFHAKKKDDLPVSNSYDSRARRGQTIVLDEEEPQPQETMEQIEKHDESMKEVKVYYPSSSRDDPEAVEISYSDFDCLAPQCYLTSTIMCFYMRNMLLQQIGQCTIVIFLIPTFTISSKRLYLTSLHWSLVIICNPDPEEESGPIVLHLDSLGLHSSRSVFHNIKRFLKEEWQYLDHEGTSSSDLPFAESIWRNLPNKITDKIISVPQQRNDYDCGLFVLFFMERFIEDAPGRLKKKDLAMFGRKWFKPEEASGLRVKIRKLLTEEFKNAKANCTLESSQPSPPSVVLEE
ncbi:ubiquitin-like-specific protease 1D isoform X3 [Humulus lupulus]|uniref:ubiquitin-like-specific protease 1D isoform X3 n=1 Tax=Humulus lupulus TaxID=3486 RepID=UPI002B407B48|nr:ubiquitin-like-specific protease 1D isoform X3 [Humulus lupulus]